MIAGRYDLTGESTAGGMGDIQECMDTHLDRRVVVKTLKPGEESRRLLDEQRALLQLRSKHVVQIFDIVTLRDTEGEKSGIVLEYIDGENLEFDSFSPDEQYTKTLWQIACGIRDIHSANVVHRDIKPQNIRIDREGVVKILDFGLSRNEGSDAHTVGIIGTLMFMAPELWTSRAVSFDQKIDIYAFGITALAILEAKYSVPRQILAQPPEEVPQGALSHLASDLPEDIVELLERCLCFAPEQRPQMDEIELSLRRHLLKGKHRAHLATDTKTFDLSAQNEAINLKMGSLDRIGIGYDGYEFKITSISGDVFINNVAITTGFRMPACCVITFGSSGGSRGFAAFNSSNPEVVP